MSIRYAKLIAAACIFVGIAFHYTVFFMYGAPTLLTAPVSCLISGLITFFGIGVMSCTALCARETS